MGASSSFSKYVLTYGLLARRFLDGRVDGASTACKRGKARRRRFASARELPKQEQKIGLRKTLTSQQKLLQRPRRKSPPALGYTSTSMILAGAKAAAKARLLQKIEVDKLEIIEDLRA